MTFISMNLRFHLGFGKKHFSIKIYTNFQHLVDNKIYARKQDYKNCMTYLRCNINHV